MISMHDFGICTNTPFKEQLKEWRCATLSLQTDEHCGQVCISSPGTATASALPVLTHYGGFGNAALHLWGSLHCQS